MSTLSISVVLLYLPPRWATSLPMDLLFPPRVGISVGTTCPVSWASQARLVPDLNDIMGKDLCSANKYIGFSALVFLLCFPPIHFPSRLPFVKNA